MIKKVFFIFLLSAFVFCKEVTVAVAANVSYAIDELVADFQSKNPSIKVYTTIGSSGKLTAQIMHNAPFDIFLKILSTSSVNELDFVFELTTILMYVGLLDVIAA